MSNISDAELQAITELPVLPQSLPYIFANGSRLDSIDVTCCECGRVVPQEHIHGSFTEFGGNVTLSAWLLCHECCVVCSYEARVRDDGTILERRDHGWEEARYAPENQLPPWNNLGSTLWAYIKRLLLK